MPDLMAIGTNRGSSMAGMGIGIGISEFRLNNLGFSPAKISGLTRWFDASDASTLFQSSGGSPAAADGDPVGYWADKSGTGGHASQGSGTNKPTLKLAIKNSLNVLRFDGVNDWMALATNIQSNPSTLFAVFQHFSPASYSTIIGCEPYGDPYFGMQYYGVNQKLYSYYTRLTTATLAGNTWFAYSTDSSVSFFRNGSADGTAAVLATSNGFSRIGCVQDGTFPFSGDIAEIICFNRVLNSTERGQIFSFLNSKWGVY